jgi:hypothetical protein
MLGITTYGNFDPHRVFADLARNSQTISKGYFYYLFENMDTFIAEAMR